MPDEQPPKIMLVTVGTSLFHSASWNFDDTFIKEKNIVEYTNWLDEGNRENDPGPLISPEKRQESNGQFKKHFKTKLISGLDEVDKWTNYFVKDIHIEDILRYSAELSTIFELGLNSKDGLVNFLKEYKIDLIADPNPEGSKPNEQYVAAKHIEAYLNNLDAGLNVNTVNVPGISSKEPDDIIGKKGISGINLLTSIIDEYLKTASELKIIASGGYKSYGFLFGQFLQLRANLFIVYRHEQGDNLMIINRDKIRFPGPEKNFQNSVTLTAGLNRI